MGGGDIKLLAMIGAFTGVKGILFTIFVGSVFGTLTGLVIIALGNRNLDFSKMPIPFGPFLSAGAVLYIFFGSELITWYFNLNANRI